MTNLLILIKMVITCEKRNKIAMDLHTTKYRKRVVKPKKGKGSFKKKKDKSITKVLLQ